MWQLKLLFFKNIINFYFLKIYFERLTSDISRLSILNYFPLARSLQVIHLQKYFCAAYIDAGKPRRRPDCAFAQTDQRHYYSLFGTYHILIWYRWNFNFLASLCSCKDWFESGFVGNPEDRPRLCRVAAQIYKIPHENIIYLHPHSRRERFVSVK